VQRHRCRSWIAAFVLVAATACGSSGSGTGRTRGSGHITTEQRAVGPFDGVELGGEGRLILSADGPPQLEVQTDDNLLPLIESTVTDGRLVISTKRDVNIAPSNGVTYRVACDRLSEVQLSGSGQIEVTGCQMDDLAIHLDGSGEIRVMGLDATKVDAEIDGSGMVTTTGRSGAVSASVTGSGSFDGSELQALDGDVQIPGSGRIDVWVTQTLQADISGSGSISYRGDPAVTKDVSGSGTVTPVGGG